MSRTSSRQPSPPPTQTTPSSVTPKDAVADGRSSESPKRRNERRSVRGSRRGARRTPPSCIAEQREDEAEVAREHERAQLPRDPVELVQRDEAAGEREPEEPPAAEVDDADDEREQDRDDRDPRPERAHTAAHPLTSETGQLGICAAERVSVRRSAAVCARTPRARPAAVRAEVGPERVHEHELGVRGLPEEEVRDALLAGGADDEVGVRELRRVEPLRERLPRTRPPGRRPPRRAAGRASTSSARLP